jgi:hypothetical protein
VRQYVLLPLHLRPRRIKKEMRQVEVAAIALALVPSMVLVQVQIKEKR